MREGDNIRLRRKRFVATFVIAISVPMLTEVAVGLIKIVAAVVREWHRGL